MSIQVEKLEKNMARLTIELSAEQFEDVMKKAFNKSKNRFNIPDFREGRTPCAIIEEMYGEGIFYEEATDEVINTTCMEAINESGLEIISRPKVVVEQTGKNKSSIYTATAAVKPEVTLGEYKDVEVEEVDAAVKPEDVGVELKKVQEQSAGLPTVEGRPTINGDQTVIDFEGSVDGKTLDDGKVADYPLAIGSHSFVDTLEKWLAGRNIDEECEISVTFPGEYHAARLIGKPATFKATVEKIRVEELPELDGEFAGEVSESDTLDEYKEDIEAKILKRKQKEATSENEDRVADKIVAGVSMEIPNRMVEDQIDNVVQDIARRMESQDLDMNLYIKYTGTTMEQMREQMKSQALKRTQTRLVLEEAVKAENLQVSDERLDEEITKMATAHQMEADKLEGYTSDRDKDQMKEDIAVQEAVDSLVAKTKLV